MRQKETGFKHIADSADGALHECPPTWPGIVAMLLRKIIVDAYDVKGVEGCMQHMDERMTLARMEATIEDTVTRYYRSPTGKPPTRVEINGIKNSLLKEFAREKISIKYLGEFMNTIDADWVDLTVVIGRKSGTTKSYTTHVGGIGITDYKRPQYNAQHFDFYKTHEVQVVLDEPSIMEKKITVSEKNQTED